MSPYLLPAAAMAMLTFVVCAKAAVDRVREVRERGIPLRQLARHIDTATTLQHSQATDNFNNLLQMPLLFQVLCLWLHHTGSHGVTWVVLLWLYVLLRVGHSVIQLTSNQVLNRFRFWMGSNCVLCITWAGLLVQQLVNG